jgi:4a-hydroxytetrahydrobiopterin dehydratase
LGEWRYILGAMETIYRAGTFAAAAELIARLGALADERDHHPEIDLRYPDRVHVVLSTHVAGGVTERDLEMAVLVSGLAAEAGCASEPAAVTGREVAIDAMDIDAIRPFWQAVLGYQEGPTARRGKVIDLVDPLRMGPSFWFQQMDEARTGRNRFHIDITVPPEVAQERIDAAIAAGGRLLSATRARAFWVLADPEGNEACICTWLDRD